MGYPWLFDTRVSSGHSCSGRMDGAVEIGCLLPDRRIHIAPLVHKFHRLHCKFGRKQQERSYHLHTRTMCAKTNIEFISRSDGKATTCMPCPESTQWILTCLWNPERPASYVSTRLDSICVQSDLMMRYGFKDGKRVASYEAT
jgi:hypothetical protein